MHRALFIAPVAFVLLAVLGLHNTIGQWLSPAYGPAKGPGAALVAPPVVRPTQAISTIVAAPSTVPPSPPSLGRADPTLAPLPTNAPSPTSNPATPTPAATPTPRATPTPLIAGPHRVAADAVPKVGAKQFIVVDGDSGAILAEQNAHEHVAPASTTKIVTALVALARGNSSDTVTAQFDQSELFDSTLMGLKIGDQLTMEDLLYGLMLPSGNDAALAIASYVAGSKSRFVQMMNDATAEMGLTDSHWLNPHGLDSVGHYSSAYDMVQFARAGMRDSRFQALAAAKTRIVRVGGRSYEIYNLNRVLGAVPGADGVKIGYTEDAGRTIVASATRNGHRVFVGAFHSSDLVADTRPLVEWAFKNFAWS